MSEPPAVAGGLTLKVQSSKLSAYLALKLETTNLPTRYRRWF